MTGQPATHEVDPQLYAPTAEGAGTGEPWCRFVAGSLGCVNGDACRNPNHRRPA